MVEIFLPVYNNEKTIEETIRSLVAQDYRDFTINIFDNASTDGTEKICTAYRDQYNNIIYHRFNELVSAEENFNRCLASVKSDFFAIFHADDVYHKSILSRQVEIIQTSNVGGVATHANIIDSNSVLMGERFLPKELKRNRINKLNFEELFSLIIKYSNFITCPSVMVRSSLLPKIGRWNGDQFKSSADLDFWFKITKASGFCILNEPLISYRISSSSLSFREVKVRTKRHDLFLVLDEYMKLFDENKKYKKQYNFLKFKDNIVISYNLLLRGQIDKDYSIKLSDISYFVNSFQSLTHAKIYFIGMSVALLQAILRLFLRRVS